MTHSGTQVTSEVKSSIRAYPVTPGSNFQQDLYRSITTASAPVESTLGASLVEHVVSEVTLRTVTSIETGMDLLRSTFLNIRMRR